MSLLLRGLLRIGRIVLITLLLVLLVASPVFAMSNPDAISFGTGDTPMYRVFYNVKETGDMLFVAEGYVYYTVPHTQNITASQAFLFEVMDNISGNTTLLSIPLNDYGDRPISIYQTAAQVSGNFTVGAAYKIRITGNPLIFPSTTNNTVTAVLGSGDYVDQLLGVDGGVATSNPMRNTMIQMATNIQKNDISKGIITGVTPYIYIVTVQGVKYLTVLGGDIFQAGIPGLGTLCPILFQASLEALSGDTPQSTGAYASSISIVGQWGTTVADGLTNIGVYLGINQALAGSLVLFVLVMMLGIYAFAKTQSGIATLLIIAAAPFLGAWLGLMPMALAFVFTIGIVVLMGYYFFTRGTM